MAEIEETHRKKSSLCQALGRSPIEMAKEANKLDPYEILRRSGFFELDKLTKELDKINQLVSVLASPLEALKKSIFSERFQTDGLLVFDRLKKELGMFPGSASYLNETFQKMKIHPKFGEDDVELIKLMWSQSAEESNFDALSDWLELNGGNITPEQLDKIIVYAMLQAESDFMQRCAKERNKSNNQKNERIPVLWENYKTKGMSKNNAAPRIAEDVNLAPSTVRKKLQGL